jgi:glycerate dehydrogenase
MKVVVLDAGTLGFPDSEWDLIRATASGFNSYNATDHSPDAVIGRCRDADCVLTNKVPMTAEIISALPNLKLISTLATGYNIIDTKAAAKHGVVVCNVPAYSTAAVAQHTLALIFAMSNKVAEHSESVHRGDWIKSEHFSYWLHELPELDGEIAGIIGWGEIARKVAGVLNALGMRIWVHTRSHRNEPDWEGFAFKDLDELCRESKLISIHCPLTPETKDMFSEERLLAMRKDAYLINTARGGIVDESALASVLKSGHLSGVALDVIEKEPMPAENSLQGLPRLLLTPHLAWASPESRRRLLKITAANIVAFKKGHPRNEVG